MNGTFVLLDVMRKHGCKNIIFSSSATVYGDPAVIPITEQCPKGHCTNPYGQTKSMLEEVLMDVQKADQEWNVVLLRYFNPIGAYKTGTIGENPNGIPNNLMPYITQVAIGKRKELGVFGNDYDTHDGTGVRDYIHVVDLAKAHVCALSAITRQCGVGIYNIGTGHGYSVLDVVNAFVKVNGVDVPIVSSRVVQVILLPVIVILARPRLNWVGKHNMVLKRCVVIRGIGRRTILTDMQNNSAGL